MGISRALIMVPASEPVDRMSSSGLSQGVIGDAGLENRIFRRGHEFLKRPPPDIVACCTQLKPIEAILTRSSLHPRHFPPSLFWSLLSAALCPSGLSHPPNHCPQLFHHHGQIHPILVFIDPIPTTSCGRTCPAAKHREASSPALSVSAKPSSLQSFDTYLAFCCLPVLAKGRGYAPPALS
ncbi:MAG: hypothetical protein Q9181_004453 [Wetmoreana brouardii]